MQEHQVASEPILLVHDLHTFFRTPTKVVRALDGVSVVVRAGEMVGVVGRSGSGKSVLARSIMGLVQEPGYVAGGSIRYDGRELVNLPERDINALRGSDIAIIVSNPRSRLNPLLGVGKQLANVIQAKQRVSAKVAYSRAIDLLRDVAIADAPRVAGLLPDELSGGMCQRVIIAMALSNAPRLLIADEPTAGLDVTVQTQVLELMKDLVRESGTSLLLMTRDLGIIAHYSERVLVLQAGKIVEDQAVSSFFRDPLHPHSQELLAGAFASRGASAT